MDGNAADAARHALDVHLGLTGLAQTPPTPADPAAALQNMFANVFAQGEQAQLHAQQQQQQQQQAFAAMLAMGGHNPWAQPVNVNPLVQMAQAMANPEALAMHVQAASYHGHGAFYYSSAYVRGMSNIYHQMLP